MKEKVNAIQLR